MSKVFISHSSADKERVVRTLEQGLRSRGIETWFDERELHPGDSLVDRIFEEGIGAASAVVIVLSNNSINSKWVREELNASTIQRLQRDIRVIPVLIDDVPVPVSLSNLLWIRIAKPDDLDPALRRIAAAIHRDKSEAPVAPKPKWTEIPVTGFVGLTPTDELVFRFVCEQVVKQGRHPYADRNDILAWAQSVDLDFDQVAEILEHLDNEYYLKSEYELGSRLPFAVRPTAYGMEQYLQQYYSDYAEIPNKVASAIVNCNQFHDEQISESTGLPLVIVDHVLDNFENRRLVTLAKALDGYYVRPSSSLQRLLR